MKFTLKEYNRGASDSELLEDLLKVSKKLNKISITRNDYLNSKLNKFHYTTISSRFNGWNKALEKAGLVPSVRRNISVKELIDDLLVVANTIKPKRLTKRFYNENGKFGSQTIINRFGWNKALEKAGLDITIQQYIPDQELFNNIEEVWVKLGKQPSKRDLSGPISKYSCSPYINRFGSWDKGLKAFINFIQSEDTGPEENEENNFVEVKTENYQIPTHKTRRDPNLKLRFLVMRRDNFKCVICGRSPATDSKVILHIDHRIPWEQGGETVFDNLQTLCSDDNWGKSNLTF